MPDRGGLAGELCRGHQAGAPLPMSRKLLGLGCLFSQSLLEGQPLANCTKDSLSHRAWDSQLLWHCLECPFWPLSSQGDKILG